MIGMLSEPQGNLLLGYLLSLAASLILLRLSTAADGVAFASLGLGAGAVFALDLGVRFWVDRDPSSFLTSFLLKSLVAVTMIPLISFLNPLAIPFLLMEPLILFADLLMGSGRVNSVALSLAVAGIAKVAIALLGLGIYAALLVGEAVGHIVRVILAPAPSMKLRLRELPSVLPETASMHLSTGVVMIVQTLGTGIIGILMGSKAALEFYTVVSIAGALWTIPGYMLSLSSTPMRPDMRYVVAFSIAVAASSPLLSGALNRDLTLEIILVSLATIPTAVTYSSYGFHWRSGRGVSRFCLAESLARIFLCVVGGIFFGSVAIGVVQAASMISASLLLGRRNSRNQFYFSSLKWRNRPSFLKDREE
ncbi:MAG: hypothetical protein QXK42_03720 [Candidatus Korarchaeum sp.]